MKKIKNDLLKNNNENINNINKETIKEIINEQIQIINWLNEIDFIENYPYILDEIKINFKNYKTFPNNWSLFNKYKNKNWEVVLSIKELKELSIEIFNKYDLVVFFYKKDFKISMYSYKDLQFFIKKEKLEHDKKINNLLEESKELEESKKLK